MIVVFVVDTSPSMGQPIQSSNSPVTKGGCANMLSRLDLAKMAVEDLSKGLSRRIQEHNMFLHQQSPAVQKSMCQIGLGYCPPNQYLLLSTSRQHQDQPATAACAAGGRLLVGYGPDNIYSSIAGLDGPHNSAPGGVTDPLGSGGASGDGGAGSIHSGANNAASFQRELKQLKASTWDPSKAQVQGQGKGGNNPPKFPDDAGGAGGLNAALSAGLQLLSRYRLHDRTTEHFGMGRLPNPAMMTPAGSFATHALQPACLILLTDGACLRKSPKEGGGGLQLQYGSMPLREWYKEPFRWDQRVFCLGIGANPNPGVSISSTQYLHPQIRALCEVTGGYHTMLQSTASLSVLTDRLLRILAPPLPRQLPMADPLKSPVTATNTTKIQTTGPGGSSSFINGGPVCCFQAIEGDQPTIYRAMLMYVPTPSPPLTPTDSPDSVVFPPPLWCIPENYFPSKKLDTLPPRSAQPMLMISRFPSKMGSKSFEPTILMKQINRLDQLILSTRQLQLSSQAGGSQPQAGMTVKLLHRDVYICEWISVDDRPAKSPQPNVYGGSEFFPVMVQDAGRPNSDDPSTSFNYFHIGILHAPSSTSTLASSTMSASSRPLSTLTLLPPEPQVLVPLLLKAVDAEHRALKKAAAAPDNSAEKMAAISRTIHVDDAWKQDFRNYALRLPPYYQMAMKRGLRSVLPASLHPLLATALASEPATGGATGGAGVGETTLSTSSMSLQCFSKACFQKLRNAEQVSRDNNERLERQEAELRGLSKTVDAQASQSQTVAQQPKSSKLASNRNTSSGDQGAQIDVGYGQYDPRSSTESFLSCLRSLPAPWLVGMDSTGKKRKLDSKEKSGVTGGSSDGSGIKAEVSKSNSGLVSNTTVAEATESIKNESNQSCNRRDAMECLGDLPANCLMAYYESRRRWIFGGSGLTTRGIMVEGVSNDGSNVQRCGADPNDYMDQSLLSLAGVGVSTLNETTVAKMGDYRERLLWSRSPVVGYGSNDFCGVAATTAADGSPKWSVDDDALPLTFFDSKTGEFSDSVQARVRSRLHVNFGNAYKDKRADSLVPEKFLSQCPSNHQHAAMGDSSTPPGSPPHDSYSSSVEEGEAMFTKSPPPKSPPHSSSLSLSPRPPPPLPPVKQPKIDNSDSTSAGSGQTSDPDVGSSTSSASPPPPPPSKRAKVEGSSLPKQPPPQQRHKPRSDSNKAMPIPATPTTPPVAPPKLKTSPGSGTPSSPKPPPPPLKSPKPTPGPPGKSSVSKRPPAPPSSKRPPPPPSLEKRPAFNLAPSKPLPAIPLKRPSGIVSASSATGDGDSSRKLPGPPSIPKPAKLKPSTSSGSVGSTTSSGGIAKPPPPPKPSHRGSFTGAPPPPPPQAEKPIEYTNKDRKPDIELPAGWMVVWSKSQKRWYFFNTRDNQSLWQWPPP